MESTLRKELHEMIDSFSEEKLQEVYELLQEDEYSDEFKQMLDKEYEDYERTGKAVSKEEVDKIIQAILSKK
jgi:DNA-binding MurR/RpiR family transcriptional regulator